MIENLCESCPRYWLADVLYDKYFGESLTPTAFSLLWHIFSSADWDVESNRFGKCSVRLSELAQKWDEEEQDLDQALRELEEADLVRVRSKRLRDKISGQLITKQACSLRYAESLKQSKQNTFQVVSKEQGK